MGSGDWAVVTAAVVLAAGCLGILLTRSLWLRRAGWPGPVATLLTFHTGAVAVVGTITAAAAARSWQLVERGPGRAADAALLGLSPDDGDGSLFALIVLFVVFGTVLATTALALSARFAAGDEAGERTVACGVLGLETCAAGYGAAQVLTGQHGVATVVLALHLPVAIAAMAVCWPPAPDQSAPGSSR